MSISFESISILNVENEKGVYFILGIGNALLETIAR